MYARRGLTHRRHAHRTCIRRFFDALVSDNLDLPRPEQVELIFGRKILPSTPGVFATRVVTRGVDVTVNVGYKTLPQQGVRQPPQQGVRQTEHFRPNRQKLGRLFVTDHRARQLRDLKDQP